MPHTKKKVREGRGFNLHIPTGSGTFLKYRPSPSSRNKDIFVVPNGFPSMESFFINKCLIVAIILGFYHREFECSEFGNMGLAWAVISQLHSSSIPKAKRAGQRILKLMKDVCVGCDISINGPHLMEDVIPKLCAYYGNIQVIVISRDSDILYMCPSLYDEALRPVCLLQTTDETNSLAHVDLIVSVKTFAAKKGWMCPVCYKVTRSQYLIHVCKRPRCSTCKRTLRKDDSYIDRTLADTFCNSESQPKEDIFCSKCKKQATSLECYQNHQKTCVLAEYCDRCRKPIYKGNFKTLSEAKEKHRCHEIFCKYCTKKYVEDAQSPHMCSFKPVTLPKSWNNLGMIHFTYMPVSGNQPNTLSMMEIFCSVLFEDEDREIFSSKHFWFQELPIELNEDEDKIRLPYLTNRSLTDTIKGLARHSLPRPFGKQPSKRRRERLEGKAKSQQDGSILQLLVSFLIGSRFQAYTFVVEDERCMVMCL